MKKIIIALLFLFSTLTYAQKEANIWYFGKNAGLDFNSGSPVALTNGKLSTTEGCATISDVNGNLLFYTDGLTVWNRNHNILLNGTQLKGDASSVNSAIIIPKPGSLTNYYIFTLSERSDNVGLHFSELDMTLDNGLGGINANKNIFLLDPLTEQLTAVKDGSGTGYWVVCHEFFTNAFRAYHISNSGVNLTPVISNVGPIFGTLGQHSQGSLKISPNGKRLATTANEMGVELFDFNDNTGVVSNARTLISYGKYHLFYGIEFSPNNNLLYFSGQDMGVFQFDLNAGSTTAIINSLVQVAEYPVLGDYSYSSFGTLQLATDGKIYAARDDAEYLDAIENPDTKGLGCNFKYDAVYLEGKISQLGLPPFIQSYFYIDPFTFKHVCLGDVTEFLLNDTFDSVVWNFGDVASGVNNTSTDLEPTHIFTAPGDYDVTLTATVGVETASTTVTVTIYEAPTATQPVNLEICDADNDGLYLLDITLQNTAILNGQDASVFDIKYYAGLDNFNANIEISTPNAYTNQLPYVLETIYAKVLNKNNQSCFDVTDFTIQVFETPKPSTTILPLNECDNLSVGTDTDGVILFDLTQKKTEILKGQSAANFTIEYYSDINYLTQITTPTAFQNTSNPQTVFVKMFNNTNNSCVATTSFELKVDKLPIVNSPVILKQCDNVDINGFSYFNLTEVNAEISNNAVNETITYFTSYNGALTNAISERINTPTAYLNPTISTSKVWARVENDNSCFRISEIELIVSTTQIPNSFQKEFYECDDFIDAANPETDGVTTFDFSSVTAEIETIFPAGQQLIINYYRNEADALAEANAISDISNYRNIGYPNTQTIYIRVDSKLDNDCLGLGGHITLHVEPIPIANTVAIDRQCDDDFDGLFPFDTSAVETTLLNGQTGMQVTYTDALGNALPSPLPNPFLTASQTIKIKVTAINSKDKDGACSAETDLTFIVDKKPVAYPVADFIECDDDLDGLFPFDTSSIESTILNGQTGMLVTYTDEVGNTLPSPLPNPFLTSTQTITVKVENELYTNCFAESTINFTVHAKPEFELENESIVCLNSLPKRVSVFNPNTADYSYVWEDAQGTEISTFQTADITKGGVYMVTATSINGCTSFPKEITIYESNIANLFSEQIVIKDDSNNNSIEVLLGGLGIGDYEFALQKESESIGFFQDEPLFENIAAGIYTVYVNDKNNCGTANLDVAVIGYPKFFTPNNDGYNDYWNVIGVNANFNSNSLIYIFDRFGKTVAKIDPKSKGWNGFYNGTSLPATDYWFTVELMDTNGNSKIRKGHFSLVR